MFLHLEAYTRSIFFYFFFFFTLFCFQLWFIKYISLVFLGVKFELDMFLRGLVRCTKVVLKDNRCGQSRGSKQFLWLLRCCSYQRSSVCAYWQGLQRGSLCRKWMNVNNSMRDREREREGKNDWDAQPPVTPGNLLLCHCFHGDEDELFVLSSEPCEMLDRE